ncbi:4-hydroxyphenylpyruvate dioxygenase [Streptomyces inusitatus]|uniref:4-hydroxyphenylpyruvate dioxygenase n=1 Tax=Streptomyces inusitatus TaxID=68221 RepID=A0A918PMR6_9ACTN|nr:VOC family protein [Streptomyces inusitatus]GGZ16156.1 4-hydroxyphenylpyruvate dioxygenase [Streptomyces inusitatus]
MQINGIDHLEFYVTDLDRSVEIFRDGYGFQPLAASTPLEDSLTGHRSVLLRHGAARVVVTAATRPDSEVAAFVAEHGDCVRNIALRVDDVPAACARATAGGAVLVAAPLTRDGVTTATVAGAETLRHTFLSGTGADTSPLPGFSPLRNVPPAAGLIEEIDHVAICLPGSTLTRTEDFYRRTLGLRRTFVETIEVGDQTMESLVLQGGAGDSVTFTLVAPDCEEGQLVDFLRACGGGGVQHVAFRSDDIVGAVRATGAHGVDFLSTPATYYDQLPTRLGCSSEDAAVLAGLGILGDRDHWGDLLQIFTRSPFPNRAVFFELIERRDARTFGTANIRALYEAAERLRTSGLVPAGTGSE